MRELGNKGDFDEGIGLSSTSISASLSFDSIEYGLWGSDGTFGHCGTMKRRGILTYNAQTGIASTALAKFGPLLCEEGILTGIVTLDFCLFADHPGAGGHRIKGSAQVMRTAQSSAPCRNAEDLSAINVAWEIFTSAPGKGMA